MMKKNKGGSSGGKTGKKSASLAISNNFSLLDPDNEEVEQLAPTANRENNSAAAAVAETQPQSEPEPIMENGYKPLKLKSVYIHNQSWKTIA